MSELNIIDIENLYNSYNNYKKILNKFGSRSPNFPEILSENIIRLLLLNTKYFNSVEVITCGKNGDLISEHGKIECKCFSSTGPISFSPTPNWKFLCILDFINKENIKIYIVNIASNSDKWNNININKKETFKDKCKLGQRPRLGWEYLYKQIQNDTTILFNDSFLELIKKLKN